MKAAFKVRAYVCAMLMVCAAMDSLALTLGGAQGAVFVGKPLDVRIQLQADTGEELHAACMAAEVFYGESLVDSARVTVSVDAAQGSSGKEPFVRVTASAVINEPIVTVNIRVGCQQKSSKRYTLFPDVATNVVEPSIRPSVQGSPLVVAAPRALAAGPQFEKTRKTRASLAAPDAQSPSKPALSPTPAPNSITDPAPELRAGVAARSKAATKTSGKSRLKLDPLDLSIERDPVLQATTELLTLPQENAALRAQAIALWRSLNASPEELLLEEAKNKVFEKDLKSLYAVTAENQKGLMDLVGKVQQAESERYANPLVYALAALCLLLLVVMVWVWRRVRSARTGSWMHGVDDTDAHDSLLAELVKSPPASRPTSPAHLAPTPVAVLPTKVAPPAEPLTVVDFDLAAFERLPYPVPKLDPVLASASPPSALAVARGGARDPSVGVSGGLRTIDSAELLDVRQQADFFMALGEHQKAIDVLTTRIAQVGESSPLVCLDLLRIYYKLGRESEFEFMRQEFNNWFTGRVPVIDDFGNEGRSLEKYPKVIDQIVALWPDPRVLEYIENCIYHHSTDAYEPDFDLLAYRDLLLLHGIAKRIVRVSDDGSDNHAAGLVRIAARAPWGAPEDLPGGGDVAHRMGAQHRGAWARNLAKNAHTSDPEADVETRGTPLSAMRLPPAPVVEHEPNAVSLAPIDGDEPDSATDIDFLNLR